MEYSRYLVAALTAFTLIMSVVSSVNPSSFAGLNAFADHEDEQEVDDNTTSSSGSNDDHEVEDDDDRHGTDEEHEEDENELVQPLGNHSKVFLELDEAELEVEIEDGDLDDGTHDIVFKCGSPDVNKEFIDSLNVTEGHGEFDADLGLSNDTYTGCEVEVGDLSTAFPTFTVIPDEHEDEDVQDEEDDEHEDDKEDNGVDPSSGSNRHNDEEENEEDDDNNSGTGTSSEDSTEDKSKERKERIVSTVSGADVHERHRNASPNSPGEYDPGWNYTLAANGTAMQTTDDEALVQEEDATVNLNMSVWKSNKAIVLLDVIDGTIEYEDQDYTVRIGYALYSTQYDVMKVVALATDHDGNVIRLKLRGNAVDEADTFPMESGSIDLILGGHFEDWNLLLEGTVEAN